MHRFIQVCTHVQTRLGSGQEEDAGYANGDRSEEDGAAITEKDARTGLGSDRKLTKKKVSSWEQLTSRQARPETEDPDDTPRVVKVVERASQYLVSSRGKLLLPTFRGSSYASPPAERRHLVVVLEASLESKHTKLLSNTEFQAVQICATPSTTGARRTTSTGRYPTSIALHAHATPSSRKFEARVVSVCMPWHPRVHACIQEYTVVTLALAA